MFRRTEVAIKQLKEGAIDKEALEEFLGEAETMCQLPPHPNVILFRGVTLPPDPPCIVLDFAPGGSLKSFLNNAPPTFDHKMQIALSIDIAKGMLHLHTAIPNREVIHRDLAARNILLGRGMIAAVSDFGMARIKEERANDSKTFQLIGPLKWMAPESIKDQIYSTKSDVFSYGVVLYEIVSRKDPWHDVAVKTAAIRVVSGERMKIPEDCHPVLSTLMIMCWQKKPKSRPTFASILDLLEPLQTPTEPGKPVHEQISNSSKKTSKPVPASYQNINVALPQNYSNAPTST